MSRDFSAHCFRVLEHGGGRADTYSGTNYRNIRNLRVHVAAIDGLDSPMVTLFVTFDDISDKGLPIPEHAAEMALDHLLD